MIRLLPFRFLFSAAIAGSGAALMSPRAEHREPRTIIISEFRFVPPEIVVSAGDTVVWENRDAFVHTSTADSATWQSGELRHGHRFRLVPGKAGRYEYHCAAHPVMRGVLNVRQ